MCQQPVVVMTPADPEMGKPVHGVPVPGVIAPDVVVDMLGAGIVTAGLRPAPAVSVAPSGMLPPTRPLPEFAASVDEKAVVVPLELEVQLEVGLMPPPSKVEREVMPLVPVIAAVELHVELGAGPRPPGLSSVAASGTVVLMPLVPLLALEPGLPSGEVAPRPDDVIAVCALAACEQRIASAANINRNRIQISYVGI